VVSSIAIISAVYPYPVDSGKKVVLRGLIDYWRDRVGNDGLHYILIGPREDLPKAPPPFRLHHIDKPAPARQLWSIARHTLSGQRSIQESTLYSPRIADALRAALRRTGADMEIYDTIRMGQYADSCSAVPVARRILYLDDLFSVRYGKMLEVLRTHPDADLNPLGAFGRMLPPVFGRLLRSTTIQRTVLRAERGLVAQSEDDAVGRFGASLLVNRQEAGELRRRTGNSRVHPIAPLLPAPGSRARAYAGEPRFVFLGLLSLPHNRYAVHRFLDDHLAAAIEEMPKLRLQIIGRDADHELLERAAMFEPHVIMEGYVEDLDAALADACALLVPLIFGTGVKLKVLEALGRGLPVLSTSVGVEGIASGPGEGCVVEDDLAAFPHRMLEMTDADWNAHLSASAGRFYAETYAPAAVTAEYDRIFAP
jgi:glycosyltransferase involved in cell wall biosynthesis